MNYLICLVLFAASSNALLLLLFRLGFEKKIKPSLLLLFSYGIGPFLLALTFYFSIWLFPNRLDVFYKEIIIGLWLVIYLFCRKSLSAIFKAHLDFCLKAKKEILKLPGAVLLVSVIFIGVYTVQLLAYPIIDNDSAEHLNQSEAVYEYKNISWQKERRVRINDRDFYSYNYAIRPGMSSLIAATYIFEDQGRYDFTSFKFIILYFYLLLLSLFLLVIKMLAVEIRQSSRYSLIYGLLFFVFSWSIARNLIFSAKETVTFFITLLSIVVASMLLKGTNTNWRLKALLILALGINVFINFNGIIIECIILFLLFVFSKKNLVSKLAEVFLIFLFSLPVGAFEFITVFEFIFVQTVTSFSAPISQGLGNEIYQGYYQTKGFLDYYLKGKLQILTNIGLFGLYFWIFLLTLGKYLKHVLRNDLSKLIVIFIGVYYFVVIDPFFLNKHPLAIVLWGSGKYALLLVFLSMIVTSVFVNKIIKTVVDFIKTDHKRRLAIGWSLLFISIAFHGVIIDLGTKFLLLSIPVFKEVSFYRNAVEIFFYLLLTVTLLLMVLLTLASRQTKQKTAYLVANFLIIFIVATPFFMTNVGKIPLIDSLSFVNKTQEQQLVGTLYEGDIFRTFFKAKELLPDGTVVAIKYSELSIYNNGKFMLVPISKTEEYGHYIDDKCETGWISLYESGQIHLCAKDKI